MNLNSFFPFALVFIIADSALGGRIPPSSTSEKFYNNSVLVDLTFMKDLTIKPRITVKLLSGVSELTVCDDYLPFSIKPSKIVPSSSGNYLISAIEHKDATYKYSLSIFKCDRKLTLIKSFTLNELFSEKTMPQTLFQDEGRLWVSDTKFKLGLKYLTLKFKSGKVTRLDYIDGNIH